MEKIFKDPARQARFEREGYLQVDLLSPDEVESLRELYRSLYPQDPPAFSSTTYASDFEFKQQASEAMAAIILPRVAEVLTDFRLLGSSFLTKAPGPQGEMPMHQDWTIVDESRHVAMNIWTPLVDCTEHNGTLEVLPGSQDYLKAVRAPTLPFVVDGYQQQLLPWLRALPTRAGQAVFINQALIHYSKPNQSDQMRLAITTGVVSGAADLRFYYRPPDRPAELETFAQEDDFLLRFEDFFQDIYARPKVGKSMGFRAYAAPQFSWKEVEERMRAYGLEPLVPDQEETSGGFFHWLRATLGMTTKSS